MFRTLIKVSISLFVLMILGAQTGFAASPGKRDKTLSDVMDEIMRTKDVKYLRDELGQPDNIKEFENYQRWDYHIPAKRNVPACRQAFAIEKATQKLAGWFTDCNRLTGWDKYGEIDANTPIPDPVVPKEISRAVAAEKAQERAQNDPNLIRRQTFADELASHMGQPEESVLTQYPNLRSSEKLDSGKTIRSYTRYGSAYESCQFYIFFFKGKVVGYDAERCKGSPNENDHRRGFTGDVFLPKTQPYAPWKQ